MLSQESLSMSSQISAKVRSSNLRQTTSESEALREAYLAIITKKDWREQITLVARDVALQVRDAVSLDASGRGRQEDEEECFSVACGELLYKHLDQNSDAVLCGRMKECHVQLLDKGASRVHAIILLVPSRCIIVADVGSALGISTVRRGSGGPCENSLPKERAVLVFRWGETVVLRLGAEQVCLSKVCKRIIQTKD